MYNPGSIADRLRELQREADTAYARLNFLNNVLGQSQEEMRKLKEENAQLKEKISFLEENSSKACSGSCHRPRPTAMDVLDTPQPTNTQDDDSTRTKQTKRNSSKV